VPRGYKTFITNAGIKDSSLDLGVVVSDVPANAAAVFTRNQIKGNPVQVGIKHIKGGKVSAVVVNSKNSNVATGKQGYDDCVKICKSVADQLGVPVTQVFPSSTGVIGRRLPAEKGHRCACVNLKRESRRKCGFRRFCKSDHDDRYFSQVCVRAKSARQLSSASPKVRA
jgi:N-acetylglutamate synthase/N-acetylornithine aminotransferase